MFVRSNCTVYIYLDLIDQCVNVITNTVCYKYKVIQNSYSFLAVIGAIKKQSTIEQQLNKTKHSEHATTFGILR